MKSFIYDRYGYDVDVKNGSFIYKNYDFRIERVEKSEEEIRALNELSKRISKETFSKNASLCYNRSSLLLTPYENYYVVLVAVEKFDVSFSDVISLHRRYLPLNQNEPPIDLNDVKTRWINKSNLVREKILPSFSLSSPYYDVIKKTTLYLLGYADSAIQYLEDVIIDYGPKIQYLSVAHKRLNSLDSYTLLNPLNLLLDSPTRDLAELYKFQKIDEKQLIDSLSFYSFTNKDISFLFSRILYPTFFFDILEESYEEKKEIINKVEQVYNYLPRLNEKIRNIYHQLKNKYLIRPIIFLEK